MRKHELFDGLNVVCQKRRELQVSGVRSRPRAQDFVLLTAYLRPFDSILMFSLWLVETNDRRTSHTCVLVFANMTDRALPMKGGH